MILRHLKIIVLTPSLEIFIDLIKTNINSSLLTNIKQRNLDRLKILFPNVNI
jgi:hypothetical protein